MWLLAYNIGITKLNQKLKQIKQFICKNTKNPYERTVCWVGRNRVSIIFFFIENFKFKMYITSVHTIWQTSFHMPYMIKCLLNITFSMIRPSIRLRSESSHQIFMRQFNVFPTMYLCSTIILWNWSNCSLQFNQTVGKILIKTPHYKDGL